MARNQNALWRCVLYAGFSLGGYYAFALAMANRDTFAGMINLNGC